METTRKLSNIVTLGGFIASFDKTKEGKNYREGITKTGIPYIAFKGMICCGDNSDYAVRFSTFIKATKVDGSPSKLYASAKEWIQTAVAKTENKDNPTYVEMKGSLEESPYVAKDGKLVDNYTQYNITRFYQFTEYKMEIDLECYISSINDEVYGEDETETGRKVMRVISKDTYNKTLELNKVFIPEDLKKDLKDVGWDEGKTALLYIDVIPRTVTKTNSRTATFGRAHVDSASEFTVKEFVVTGGTDAYEEENSITPEEVRDMTNERMGRHKEIENAGYLGSGAVGSRTSANGVSNSRGFEHRSNKEEISDEMNW